MWNIGGMTSYRFNRRVKHASRRHKFRSAAAYRRAGASFKNVAMEQTMVGHDSSVGIATHYGLDGQRIESRRGRDFQHLSRPDLGPIQPTIQWISRFFPEGKATGAWR